MGGVMEAVKALENKVVEINKSLPQIPENGKKALAEWFWAIAIFAVVIGVLGILAILGIGAAGSFFLTGLGGGLVAASLWPSILFGVVGMGIVVLLEAMAINPLKRHEHRGWQLMLSAVSLQAIFSVLQSIFSNSFSGIFGTLLGLAIGLYLLAQVHSYFVKTKTASVRAK